MSREEQTPRVIAVGDRSGAIDRLNFLAPTLSDVALAALVTAVEELAAKGTEKAANAA